MSTSAERESMEYDVVVVGGVGAHILSGAVIETRALDELLPDWKENGAPLNTAVTHDEVHLFTNERKSVKMPNFLIPPTPQC